MKRFFVRKFVFEGKTEWLNSFIALLAAMFILSVFLLGFYNSRSSNLYNDSNSKESKAILDTTGFVANVIFNNTSLEYAGDPATPPFRDTPIGYHGDETTRLRRSCRTTGTLIPSTWARARIESQRFARRGIRRLCRRDEVSRGERHQSRSKLPHEEYSHRQTGT
jgi:preprotein translocase subunit SecG